VKTCGPILAAALNEAARSLTSASPTPRLDAEVLLMHVCDLARTALVVRANESLTTAQYDEYRRLVDRRRTGEPVAYITGEREFWSLSLAVSPAVLIPRTETELLVERALTHIPQNDNCAIADLGTGSGAIALAIARERPRATVFATDVSADALDVAERNTRKLGVTNVVLRASDWFAALTDKAFDVIVSNPPYISADDAHLGRGDVRHEPRAALIGGVDGLDAIRKIANDARTRLKTGGWLLLEHGYDQADAVTAILQKAGFAESTCYLDLAGQPRVTEAR
jgi:release factor glutamine methyltransferase